MMQRFKSLLNAAKVAITSPNVMGVTNKVFLWMLQLLQQLSWYISIDSAIRESRAAISAPPTFLYLPPGYGHFNDTSPYTEDAIQSLGTLWRPSDLFIVKYSFNELIANHIYVSLILSLMVGVLIGVGIILLYIHRASILRLARFLPMSPLLLGTPAESTFVQSPRSPLDEKKEDNKSIRNSTFEFLFGLQATPGSIRKIRHYSETGRGPSPSSPEYLPSTPSPILNRLYISSDSPAFDLALHQPMMISGIGLGISVPPIEYLRSRMAANQEDVIVNQVTIPDALERPEVAEYVQNALGDLGKEYKDAGVGQDDEFEANDYLDEPVLGDKGDASVGDLAVMKIDIGVQTMPEVHVKTELAICSKCHTHISEVAEEKIIPAPAEVENHKEVEHVTTELKESSLDIMDAFEHAMVEPSDDDDAEEENVPFVSILEPINCEPSLVITSPAPPRPTSAFTSSCPSPSSPPPQYAQVVPQVEDREAVGLPDDSKVVKEVERQEQEQAPQEVVVADETFELPYEEMAKWERLMDEPHMDLPEIDYEKDCGLEPEKEQQEQAPQEVVVADETFELPYEEMAKWERLMGEPHMDLPEIDYEKEFGLGPEKQQAQNVEAAPGADDTFELPIAEMEKYERPFEEPMNLPEEDYVGLIPEEMDEEYRRKMVQVMKEKQERYRIRKAKANGERPWIPSKEDKKIIDFLRPWEDQLCKEFNDLNPNAPVQDFVQYLKKKAKAMKKVDERKQKKVERKADREIQKMFLPWMDDLTEEFTRVHPNGDKKQFQKYLREDAIQARAEIFAVLVNPYLEQYEDATVDGVQAFVAQWAVEERKTHGEVTRCMEKKQDEEDARIIELLAPQRQELIERFTVEQPNGDEDEFMVFLREYAAEMEKRQEFVGLVTSFLEEHPEATEEEYVAFIGEHAKSRIKVEK